MKFITGYRIQKSDCLWEKVHTEGEQGNFLGSRNVLYLDLGHGNLNTFSCKNSPTLRPVYFTVNFMPQ